jgi:hypothetical protein
MRCKWRAQNSSVHEIKTAIRTKKSSKLYCLSVRPWICRSRASKTGKIQDRICLCCYCVRTKLAEGRSPRSRRYTKRLRIPIPNRENCTCCIYHLSSEHDTFSNVHVVFLSLSWCAGHESEPLQVIFLQQSSSSSFSSSSSSSSSSSVFSYWKQYQMYLSCILWWGRKSKEK